MATGSSRCLPLTLALLASLGCFAPTYEARLAGPDAGPRADGGQCTGSCAGKQCGTDGCGLSCGNCAVGLYCDSAGQCGGCSDVAQRCGSLCCGNDQRCLNGACVTCGCGSRVCGSDACGSYCGTCLSGQTCNWAGQCVGGDHKCQSVVCNTGEACDTNDGVCKCAGSPNQGSCPANQICSMTLRCVRVEDPCMAKMCTGETPVCVVVAGAAVCQCNTTSCGPNRVCAGGQCKDLACSPACTGETPECDAATWTCKCNASSCGTGRKCVAGQCQYVGCSPACYGETPDCDAASLTCRCNAKSCNVGRDCVNGVCTQSVCLPPCAGEMPDCVATLCRCNAISCGAGKTCEWDGLCHLAGVCTVESSYGALSVAGTTQSATGFLMLNGPLPSTDGTTDQIQIELYEGYGAFLNGTIRTGTFALTGDDLNYGTCGICVRLFGNVDSTGSPAASHLATAGTLTLSSITGTLGGTLLNGTFEHVDIAADYTSTPNPDGCISAISRVDFTGPVSNGCDPLAQNCADPGQACYLNWANHDFECMLRGVGFGPCSLQATTPFCAAGTDCFLDGSGIGAKCESYCAVGGVTCLATETCTDLGDGVNGYCAPAPIKTCNVLLQLGCPGGKACYPASNGATSCAVPGNKAIGDKTCVNPADCVAGATCATDPTGGGFVCAKICNPVGLPSGCLGFADQCEAYPGNSFGVCRPCPAAQVCGMTCCATTEVCDTTATPFYCTSAPVCDPVTQQPCTPVTQGCYYAWETYSYVCKAAGSKSVGASCVDDSECVPGDGCMGANWDICYPYCDVSAPTCAAGQTCTDTGDGNGWCQ